MDSECSVPQASKVILLPNGRCFVHAILGCQYNAVCGQSRFSGRLAQRHGYTETFAKSRGRVHLGQGVGHQQALPLSRLPRRDERQLGGLV